MATYKDSGVDIDAGDRAVELMKASIARASRPEVMGGIGGFAGLFDASALKEMKQPLLATSTDGVGTKTEIARQMGKYDTIGEDLVAMVVDDLVVCGAEPLFMTDYIAVGKLFQSALPISSLESHAAVRRPELHLLAEKLLNIQGYLQKMNSISQALQLVPWMQISNLVLIALKQVTSLLQCQQVGSMQMDTH